MIQYLKMYFYILVLTFLALTNATPLDDGVCVCVQATECSSRESTRMIESRNQYCSSGEVCCQHKLDLTIDSEDDFARLLEGGDTNHTDASPTGAAKCVCIHEDQCDDPEQSLFTLVRTGNPCSEPFHVCCNNPIGAEPHPPISNPVPMCKCVNKDRCEDVIGEHVPEIKECIIPSQICCENYIDLGAPGSTEPKPGPKPGTKPEPLPTDPVHKGDCICVHEDSCYDPELDLFLTVDLRSKICSKPFHVCCKNLGVPPVTETTPSSSSASPNCGVRHPGPIGIDLRVFGGAVAKEGEYPWMVAIMKKNETGHYNYACGGSLIHPSVVLTVGHCIDGEDAHLIQVRIGELDLSGPSEILGHAEIYVNGKVLHPYYSRRSLRFDVGLLFLGEEILPTQHINTVCLPGTKPLKKYHKECFSSGWGKDKYGDEGRYQPHLKKIDLPLVSNHDCQKALRGTHLGPKFRLHKSFLCAGGEGKDTCSGDGGSPLVCPLGDRPQKLVQVGAVAWGVGCGTIGLPGVYASIAPAMEWITQTVNNNYGVDASDWFTL